MHLDEARFLRAVERKRTEAKLSWRELGRRLNLSASTLTRLARGRRPDLDTFLRLLAWLGEPADRFITVEGSAESTPEAANVNTLTVVAQALENDPTLTPEDARAIEDIVHVAYRRLRRS